MKLTNQMRSSVCLMPTVWPANRLIFWLLKQMRPQVVTVAALSSTSLPGANRRVQLRPYPIEHAPIFTGFALPEQPHRRIPGAVVATEQPTPIGPVRQKDPGRTSQRAGEVDDAGIDRDHQIEARNKGRGFCEIGEVSGQIYDFSPLRGGSPCRQASGPFAD